jgi:RHS repeat-associated protein
MPHDVTPQDAAFELDPLDVSPSPSRNSSGILSLMKEAGRELVGSVKQAGGKALLATMMVAGVAMCADKPADAQCYAFPGVGGNISFTITNLPAPVITSDGHGDNIYTYTLSGLPGNSSSITYGSMQYSTTAPDPFVIQTEIFVNSGADVIVTVAGQPPQPQQVFAQVQLFNSQPNGMTGYWPPVLPPITSWENVFGWVYINNNQDSYRVTAITNCAGMGKTLGAACDTAGGCDAGDPITLGTGNVYEQFADYKTKGTNPLGFTRYYNNQAASFYPATFAATLGANWRSNYDRYLNLSGGTTVLAERPDGQVLTFTQNGGSWVGDTDVDYTLTNNGSTWTLKNHDDTVETYTAISPIEAQLNSIRLRNGYTQTLTYNGSNQLMTVTDSYNRALNFGYSNGLLQTVTTPDNFSLTYGYTPVGATSQLTSVAYSPAGTSQTYLYENASFPLALTGIKDENGNRYATWSYDSQGCGASSQHGTQGADLTNVVFNADGTTTVTNAFGVADTYTFTTLQGVPKITQISRAATSTTAAATRTFGYDSNGFLNSETDWNGNQTSYVNNSHGQPTRITEPTRTTTISYDGTWPHLPHNIVTSGLTTSFSYDHHTGELLFRKDTDTTTQNIPYSTNGIIEEWQYTWQNGLLASAQTPLGHTAHFAYDGSGALTQITNALGQQTNITSHTGGGLPLTIVDANSVTTTFAYDGRLRLNTSTVHTSAGNLTTTYNHDAAGNLQSVVLPDDTGLNYGYDAAHRLTSVTDLAGQSVSYTLDYLGDPTLVHVADSHGNVTRSHSGNFDALGRVLQDIGGVQQTTTFTYDGNGNALTITDPLNDTTTQVFDALNRLTKSTDPTNHATHITYDKHDRPLTVTDPNSGETTYTYDGFGDVIQQVSPDSGTTVYYYDLDGNRVKRVAATNAVTKYTYDALDRVLTTKYPADPSENVTYSYDHTGHGFGIGRLTNVSDAAGSLSRSYDERGNVTHETRTIGSVQLRTSYGYNAASRLSSITYPSGWIVRYSHNSRGEVISVKAQPHDGSQIPVLSTISYEPFGPVRAMTFGNNVAESRSFDLDYRLKTLHDLGTAYLQKLGYTYDAANNVKTISDAVNPANNQALGYDVLNRLIGASGAYGDYGWTYGKTGSRLTETLGSATTDYHYGTHDNQLLSLSVNGVTTERFGYTADGNMNGFNPGISSPDGESITSLTYNQAGQLAAVTSGNEPLAQYTYDGFGQRLVKTLPPSSGALYQHDLNGYLLEETDAQGNPQADYIYLDGTPVGTISPGANQVYFLHADRLGTPQLATDSAQQTAWSATYLPFGQTSSVQGMIMQNLRLPGQHFDSESGWNHNGFRDYAQNWGRYLQTDPIGLAGGMNTYQYARANPVNFIDPKGTITFTDIVLRQGLQLLTGMRVDTLGLNPYVASACTPGLYAFAGVAFGPVDALLLIGSLTIAPTPAY